MSSICYNARCSTDAMQQCHLWCELHLGTHLWFISGWYTSRRCCVKLHFADNTEHANLIVVTRAPAWLTFGRPMRRMLDKCSTSSVWSLSRRGEVRVRGVTSCTMCIRAWLRHGPWARISMGSFRTDACGAPMGQMAAKTIPWMSPPPSGRLSLTLLHLLLLLAAHNVRPNEKVREEHEKN